MKKLRIGYLSTMYHTSHLLKQLKWVERLMEVETDWVLFGTGPAMVEAFAAGRIEIGYIGLPPAMIGMGRGVPLVCVGGGHAEGTVMIAAGGCAACGKGEDPGPVLKQFAGKKIGSPSRGSIHDVIIRFMIAKYRVEGVEVRNYPWADLIPEAIRDGEIDAAVGTPPLAVLAARWYGQRIILPPAAVWPFNPSYGIVVNRDLLGEGELLKDFLTLHEKACNLIINQPEEAARTVAEAVQVVDSDFVVEVFSISPRYCAALPQPYLDAAMAFVPVLREMGYLSRDLSCREVFDLSLIEAVHPDPHHYLKALKV